MPNAAAGQPSTLSDLGVKINRDGTFSLDTDVLSKTWRKPRWRVRHVHQRALRRLRHVRRHFPLGGIHGRSGLAGGVIAALNTKQTTLATQLSDLQTKQETLRTQLVTRYAALATAVSARNRR
jgi:flagellar hook-associated protein 2